MGRMGPAGIIPAIVILSILTDAGSAGYLPACGQPYGMGSDISHCPGDPYRLDPVHDYPRPGTGIVFQDSIPLLSQLTTDYFQAINSRKSPQEIIGIIKQILRHDPGSSTFWFYLGEQHKLLIDFNPAIEAFQKSLDLYSGSSAKPMIQLYDYMGYCYHMLGYYKQEMRVYEEGGVHYPGNPILTGRQAICYYALGKIRDANSYLSQYKSYWYDRGMSEADILHNIGILFLDTDDLKAERYFRAALGPDPDDIEKQASLARVLISLGVRMEEAMNILGKALELEPDNPTILHLYGWGYFRLEEYTLARDYLAQAESLYPEYNHNLRLHLDKTNEILSINLFNPKE